MSICTFIAADLPLPEVKPSKEYAMEINIDTGTIYDGGADDNYYLLTFADVSAYTDKKFGVYLEWNYTDGRAERIVEYIKNALHNTEVVELWHVWLMDYYEYDDSPVIHKGTLSFRDLTTQHIKEISCAEIWNKPDKMYPGRTSFYRLVVTR